MSQVEVPLVTNQTQIYSPKLIVGDVGAGKTLLMAYLGILEAEKGRQVYSNFRLAPAFADSHPDIAKNWHYIVNFTYFFRERLLRAKEQPYTSYEDLLLVDEGWEIWEARESLNPYQILMSRMVFLSRKLGLELFVSCQLSSSLDKRVRFLAEFWILAEKKFTQKTKLPFFRYYRWLVNALSTQLEKLPTVTMENDLAKQVFGVYETTRMTSTEFETTLSELDAMFNSGPQERAAEMVHQDESMLRMHILKYLSVRAGTEITVSNIGKADEFEPYNLKRIQLACTWLADNKLIEQGRRIHGLRAYVVNPANPSTA